MTLSIYNLLYKMEGKPLDQIRTKLKEANITLFAPLYHEMIIDPASTDEEPVEGENPMALDFPIPAVAAIIIYMIFAYSKDSPKLVFGADSYEAKVSLLERLEIDPKYHDKILTLKSKKFRYVMIKYLDYQSSRTFKLLTMKKIMFEQLEEEGFYAFINDKGSFDTKLLNEMNKSKEQILKEILELEERLKDEFRYVYSNKDEAAVAEGQVKHKKYDDGRIENSDFID